jgi:hypothetical protein
VFERQRQRSAGVGAALDLARCWPAAGGVELYEVGLAAGAAAGRSRLREEDPGGGGDRRFRNELIRAYYAVRAAAASAPAGR